MQTNRLLTQEEIETRLADCPGWVYRQEENCLHKVLIFKDFITAFAVMAQVAMWAEKLNHHPDWMNVYNRLEIRLNTHDLGGVSFLDFELLARIEESVAQRANLEAWRI
ncbi:MAG: 4a-hydroxytetrahydrobiopterin dehydratase [Candidatus Cloacimonetes bacterium]|nr:4a-hydroxytetrahydrobiopterin dehydratase [Candidatus Cloacimonadota bacterium]